MSLRGGSGLQYKDISVDAFVALTKTHRVVIFGTGRVLKKAWKRLAAQGMDAARIRLFMDNAGINVVFEYVTSLPITGRGKSKLVIQHLNNGYQ